MPIKFLVFGGVFSVLGGGEEKCRFYFSGRRDFSETSLLLTTFFLPIPKEENKSLSKLVRRCLLNE